MQKSIFGKEFEHTVEQTAQLLDIWYAIALISRHINDFRLRVRFEYKLDSRDNWWEMNANLWVTWHVANIGMQLYITGSTRN